MLPGHMLGRLYLLAAILTIDCVALASVPHIGSLLGPFAPAGIAAFAAFLGLGHSSLRQNKDELRFSWPLFGGHLFCVVTVVLCNVAALRGTDVLASRPVHFVLTAVVIIAIGLLSLACIPLSAWNKTMRTMTSLCIAALLAGIAAGLLRHPFQLMWVSSSFSPGVALQKATFHAVNAVLRHVLPDLTADAATFILGTPRFLVFIAPECSGMEGLGLVLVFTSVWLWHFRKESRFPQALLLIPCALIIVWLLNIARIAAIILIGNAGAPDVAMIGFHSQAGWIAFTAVALLFSMATQKIPWVRRAPTQVSAFAGKETTQITGQSESSATAAFLVPFLAILAASFVSRAASASIEWLYPLRFVAGAIAIWYFRKDYKGLDWRFGWQAPLTGAAVFIAWIAPHLLTHAEPAGSLDAALAPFSPVMRTTWIALHVAAAITVIPIAEELAFRGYLARRLISREFDAVLFANLSLLSIVVSSIAFGLLQGSHWFAGIVAGLAYAVLLKRRRRLGDAIVAHATTNLLLAVWVLLSGDWSLW